MEAIKQDSLDPLFVEAALLIFVFQQGSTSLLQRKLKIGYQRAGKIMDELETSGIVGSFNGVEGRIILTKKIDELQNLLSHKTGNKIPAKRLIFFTRSSLSQFRIECFKNIIDIVIPSEEHKNSYKAVLENLVVLDDLYCDFFKLISRVYLRPVPNLIGSDMIWPFLKVRLAALETRDLRNTLEKRIMDRIVEITITHSGFPNTNESPKLFQLQYKTDAAIGIADKEKLPALELYSKAAGIVMTEVKATG